MDSKILVLTNGEVLITQIEETPSELGEPDCKLIKPYTVSTEGFLSAWMSEYTNQTTFMIHSDKILTIIDPKDTISKKYEDIIS